MASSVVLYTYISHAPMYQSPVSSHSKVVKVPVHLLEHLSCLFCCTIYLHVSVSLNAIHIWMLYVSAVLCPHCAIHPCCAICLECMTVLDIMKEIDYGLGSSTIHSSTSLCSPCFLFQCSHASTSNIFVLLITWCVAIGKHIAILHLNCHVTLPLIPPCLPSPM